MVSHHRWDRQAPSLSGRRRRAHETLEAKHDDGKIERERFGRKIQPKLTGISLSQIVEATGFSVRYASLVRSREYVPHPVHYGSIETLAR